MNKQGCGSLPVSGSAPGAGGSWERRVLPAPPGGVPYAPSGEAESKKHREVRGGLCGAGEVSPAWGYVCVFGGGGVGVSVCLCVWREKRREAPWMWRRLSGLSPTPRQLRLRGRGGAWSPVPETRPSETRTLIACL